jgi:hypothetical protein
MKTKHFTYRVPPSTEKAIRLPLPAIDVRESSPIEKCRSRSNAGTVGRDNHGDEGFSIHGRGIAPKRPGSSHFPQLRGSALSFEGLLDSSLKFGKELA